MLLFAVLQFLEATYVHAYQRTLSRRARFHMKILTVHFMRYCFLRPARPSKKSSQEFLKNVIKEFRIASQYHLVISEQHLSHSFAKQSCWNLETSLESLTMQSAQKSINYKVCNLLGRIWSSHFLFPSAINIEVGQRAFRNSLWQKKCNFKLCHSTALRSFFCPLKISASSLPLIH